MKNNINSTIKHEISVLEMLITIIDSLRLLVIGPMLSGIFAFCVILLWPKTYESIAILKADQMIANLMLSAAVLDPIAADLGSKSKLDLDEAREKLNKQIKVNFKEKLITIVVQGDSPQSAQQLARDVLKQTYIQSQPRYSEKFNLEKQLEQAQFQEKEANQTAQLLARKIKEGNVVGTSDIVQGYAQMLGIVKDSQAKQIDVERQLRGLDESILLQNATLPTKHAAPKRTLVVVMVVFMTVFFLIIFIFLRQGLRNSRKEVESAQKLNAINVAWCKALGR
jgi:capsular polysaccharide biosynthesis protein